MIEVRDENCDGRVSLSDSGSEIEIKSRKKNSAPNSPFIDKERVKEPITALPKRNLLM